MIIQWSSSNDTASVDDGDGGGDDDDDSDDKNNMQINFCLVQETMALTPVLDCGSLGVCSSS